MAANKKPRLTAHFKLAFVALKRKSTTSNPQNARLIKNKKQF